MCLTFFKEGLVQPMTKELRPFQQGDIGYPSAMTPLPAFYFWHLSRWCAVAYNMFLPQECKHLLKVNDFASCVSPPRRQHSCSLSVA